MQGLAPETDTENRVENSRRRDRELVDAILRGEVGAFDRLFALHSKKIYGFALNRLRDPVDAEDVVQDTFLEVHRSLSSWEGRSGLLTWMFGIAHHQLGRRFRKKNAIGVPIESLEGSPAIASVAAPEQRIDAARRLAVCADVLDREVSTAQREIFDLYYGGGRPMKEIAEDLDKTSQAIKISLFRTRRTMDARLASCDLQRTG